MMMIRWGIVLLFAGAAAFADESADTGAAAEKVLSSAPADTVIRTDSVNTVDTVSTASEEESAVQERTTVADTVKPPVNKKSSAPVAGSQQSESSVKKIKLRKKSYNYRQQITLAIGMMAFIAVIMFTDQSLNPE